MLTTPGGQAGVDERLHQVVDGERRVGGRLDDAGVAADQRRKELPLGMAMGKFHGVIRPTTPTGMRMLMANLFCSSTGGGLAEEAAAFAGDVKGLVDGFLHVAAGFGEHLAHFAGHVAGELLLALLQQDAGADEDLGALGRGNQAPGGEGLLRGGDGFGHVFRAGGRETRRRCRRGRRGSRCRMVLPLAAGSHWPPIRL